MSTSKNAAKSSKPSRSDALWGGLGISEFFTAVPDILLTEGSEMGLWSEDILWIIQVHRCVRNRTVPYASALGIEKSASSRCKLRIEKLGLLVDKTVKNPSNKIKSIPSYDFAPLYQELARRKALKGQKDAPVDAAPAPVVEQIQEKPVLKAPAADPKPAPAPVEAQEPELSPEEGFQLAMEELEEAEDNLERVQGRYRFMEVLSDAQLKAMNDARKARDAAYYRAGLAKERHLDAGGEPEEDDYIELPREIEAMAAFG